LNITSLLKVCDKRTKIKQNNLISPNELSQRGLYIVLPYMTVFFRQLRVLIVILFISQGAWGQNSISSEEFVNLALKQNLDIRLATAQSEEVKAIASGIRIPPPSVGFTQINMNGGQTAQGWQVSQTIPFPTKLSRDYSARQHAIYAQKEEELITKQEVTAQAKLIYFLIWESQEQESILLQKKEVLKKHISIAKSVAQSDTFAKIHVLKAESELDRIENELELVSQTHQERLSMAAQVLDKNPATFKLIATNPGLSSVPIITSVDDTPQIQAMDHHLQHYKYLEKAAQSEWLPDLTVNYSHMGETLRFPENNQIMVGVTLPFAYFWQPGAKSDESSAQRIKTEINLNKVKRNIQADKMNLDKAIQTLKNQMAILNDKILPRALKRKKLFQNIAPRDLSSLQEHLDTYLAIPDIHLQILILQSKYEQAVAMLSRYKVEKGGSN
jgi:outer membrane protein, heavy metal efflux system